MKMENLNEMLDNIVQRIDDEGEAQGVQFSYMVWVVDATDGRGDLRNNGDIDALLAMSVMAQHKLCHELENQGCIKKVLTPRDVTNCPCSEYDKDLYDGPRPQWCIDKGYCECSEPRPAEKTCPHIGASPHTQKKVGDVWVIIEWWCAKCNRVVTEFAAEDTKEEE